MNSKTFSRLLRKDAVEELTGLSISTINRRMAAGSFPIAISIGGRLIAWRSEDIEAWLASPASWQAESASEGVQ